MWPVLKKDSNLFLVVGLIMLWRGTCISLV